MVQVWFQNARAKEKKARLHLQQLSGQEPDMPAPPEECTFCGVTYEQKHLIQEHLFSKRHLDSIRTAMEEGRHDPESPGHALLQAAQAYQPSADQPQSPRPQGDDAATDASESGPPPPPPPPGGVEKTLMQQAVITPGPKSPDN